MVKYFKKALGLNGEVHVCNSDDKTVAFHYADKHVVSPMIYSNEYIPFLLEYCKENKINIVISLFDIDLPVLAKNRNEFEKIGVKLIVSNEEIVNVCNDKWQTYLFLKQNGFNVPKTFINVEDVIAAIKNGEVNYPIIVKPRFGCGSIALSMAEDEEELIFLTKKNTEIINKSYLRFESSSADEKIIFQECLKGQEHGVDIINDLNGNFVNALVKKKIAMRSGETDIAEVVENENIFRDVKRLSTLTKHIANMDCDVFLVDGKPYILEMNARFGGGYPFSHVAGCNLPKAIIKWVKGKKVKLKTLQAKPGCLTYKELFLTKTKDK